MAWRDPVLKKSYKVFPTKFHDVETHFKLYILFIIFLINLISKE
jgi:hypothetical protein